MSGSSIYLPRCRDLGFLAFLLFFVLSTILILVVFVLILLTRASFTVAESAAAAAAATGLVSLLASVEFLTCDGSDAEEDERFTYNTSLFTLSLYLNGSYDFILSWNDRDGDRHLFWWCS